MEKRVLLFRRMVQAVFVLSLPFFTLMVLHSGFGKIGYVISLLLSFVAGLLISNAITKSFFDKWKTIYTIGALVIAGYICFMYAWQGNGVYIMQMQQDLLEKILPIQVTSKRLLVGLFVASLPAVFLILHYLIQIIVMHGKQFVVSLDKFEKWLLIGTLIGACGIIILFYSQTGICYHAMWDDNLQIYDVLYTTDSSGVYSSDCYFRILSGANDIRQPLFGVFALPFALLAKIVSLLLFWVPEGYAFGLGIIQYLTEAIAIIMLMRMLKIQGKERVFFVFLNFASYAYLIHGLMLEQYTIAFFYVILVLYMYQKCEGTNYSYFGAVSTLLTSGILFGLITKSKNVKQWITDIFKAFVIYMGMVTVCGQLPQFLGIGNSIEMLASFTGESVTVMDKWRQFTHFVSGIFWSTQGEMTNIYFPSYRNVELHQVSWIGIIILICAVWGFVVTREEWISKLALSWILFSGVILLGIGWGTAENGLLLYALYFAWAYIVLIYQFLKKICKNSIVFKTAVLVLVFTMIIRNGYELIQIYQFGIEYYPM